MVVNLINRLLLWLELKPKPEVEVIPEYHLPLTELPGKYYDIIHADIRFNSNERIQITKAVQEWNIFCNNHIRLELRFDYEHSNLDFEPYRTALHRAHSKDSSIKNFEEESKICIIGLCMLNKTKGSDMYLVYNRLYNNLSWKTVTLHEIGHHLGLDHVEGNAIMRETNKRNPITLTRLDAVEFGRVYEVDPDDLVYAID